MELHPAPHVLDARADLAPDAPLRSWCLFRSRRAAYAVGLEAVAEVVEIERLVRLPQSPPHILGLCALRRDVIPVISLQSTDVEPPARLLVVILRTSQGAWGVSIDGEGTAVAEGVLEPSDSVACGGVGAIIGVIRREGSAHAVIDPEGTWRRLRRGAEEWYGGLGGQSPDPSTATAEIDPLLLASGTRAST